MQVQITWRRLEFSPKFHIDWLSFRRNFLCGLVLAYCRRGVSCAKMSCLGHEMQIDLGHVREISFLVVSYDNDQAVQYTCQYTISEKLYLDILTNKFCVVSLRFSQYIAQYTVLRYCL
ncbi:Hypothetical_protein [Hexamita inflata]|uniref:Hypothetical_protein n=1 Tax=Hexamita inflata TaxID=28002 RepID=A0AA86RTE1_9EUKA|nr:Hypothetical protein HINF_LOCUS65377 [Hexamita inflata]